MPEIGYMGSGWSLAKDSFQFLKKKKNPFGRNGLPFKVVKETEGGAGGGCITLPLCTLSFADRPLLLEDSKSANIE